VVPALYSMTRETADWLEEYVRAGGQLVVTFASGIADENQRIVLGGYPGMLCGLLGVRGEQIFPLAVDDAAVLDNGLESGSWTELIHADDAEVLARYSSGPLSGDPAITRRSHGAGTAIYVSTKLTQSSLDAFLTELADAAGVEPVLARAMSHGVEAVRRRGAAADYLFLLHHGDHPVRIEGEGVDLISGSSDSLSLPPGGVAVIREAGRAWSIRHEGDEGLS
jgi:beta-galactosidase